jgi:hypothetical protein
MFLISHVTRSFTKFHEPGCRSVAEDARAGSTLMKRTPLNLISERMPVRFLALLFLAVCIAPGAHALPSFARQTGQKCAACHTGGSWPQLTPWGRFFKLSGYTAGKKIFDTKEGFRLNFVPAGVLGQVGLTYGAQPNDANGQTVIPLNGSPAAYAFTGEIGAGLTDFLGVFYEYQVGNQFPGWKGKAGEVDTRAVHFFHPAGNELLVGIDSNNNPSVQDVWNTAGAWGFPYYASPQGLSGAAAPMIAKLGQQSGGTGVYALLNREWYAEVSMYRAGNGFYRWMNPATAFDAASTNYLAGYNPYWRGYWTRERGAHSVMVGTFGMQAKVYPNSADPSGPTDVFTDNGFDSQYQYLGGTHKTTLRASYTYEKQQFNASFMPGDSSVPKGNLKSLSLNGSYSYRDQWTATAGYFSTHGNDNASLYSVVDPSGTQLTASPNTSGYMLELDRLFTQNLQVSLQYKGFLKFNGLTNNTDGLGRPASANNTLWLTAFFSF